MCLSRQKKKEERGKRKEERLEIINRKFKKNSTLKINIKR